MEEIERWRSVSFFSQRERRVDLELVETRTLGPGVVHLRYRVAR